MMPAGNDADVAADAALGSGTMNYCFAAGAAFRRSQEIEGSQPTIDRNSRGSRVNFLFLYAEVDAIFNEANYSTCAE
jgi:hypothetical protein